MYSFIFHPLRYRAAISTPASSTLCLFLLLRADISTPAFSTPAFSVHPTLTFDPIFIGVQCIVMDYHCAKFGDISFSSFGFNVRTDRQNHRGGSTLYSRDYRRRDKNCRRVSVWGLAPTSRHLRKLRLCTSLIITSHMRIGLAYRYDQSCTNYLCHKIYVRPIIR